MGRDPGTTLHHVRTLVEAGFLEATDVRRGASGALEKPYRSTGKSWEISVDDDLGVETAVVSAFRDELQAAGSDRILVLARFANRLNEASYRELDRRLRQIVDEFGRRNDPDGVRMAFLLGGHMREPPPTWARDPHPDPGAGPDPDG